MRTGGGSLELPVQSSDFVAGFELIKPHEVAPRPSPHAVRFVPLFLDLDMASVENFARYFVDSGALGKCGGRQSLLAEKR